MKYNNNFNKILYQSSYMKYFYIALTLIELFLWSFDIKAVANSLPAPEIHSNMTAQELEGVVKYITGTGNDPLAIENILIEKYDGNSRNEALKKRQDCFDMGRSYCESEGFIYKNGAGEIFCYLWENHNELAKEILPKVPWPTSCSIPPIERINEIKTLINYLNKLAGDSISTSCGSMHSYIWRSIYEVKQSISFQPQIPKKDNDKFSSCSKYDPWYCKGPPESFFGLNYWSQQGLWEKEEYTKLQKLQKAAIAKLASYYKEKKLLSQQYEEAAKYSVDRLTDSYIGITGVQSAHIYTTSYWSKQDLDNYLKTGAIDKKSAGYYADKNISDRTILSYFLYLAVVNNYDGTVIKKLIKDGAYLTLSSQGEEDKNVETPLMQAVNRPDIIELLLSKGADANAQNYFGKTALMYAIQYQSNDAIKLLLKSGANIHLTTFDTKENWMLTSSCSGYALKAGKRTALMYAAWHATPEIVRLLIDKGANKSLKDTNGDSACNYIDKNESIAEQQRKDMQGILCDN